MPRNSKRMLTPRVSLVEPPYDEATAAALEALGPPIALFRAFARRPDRASAVVGWGSYYLSRKLGLTLRQRELVIDRTTALCGADYEWGIHIAVFGDRVGLTGEQVESLAIGQPDDPCWTDPADRAVLHAVDGLYRHHDLSDEQWSSLVGAVGEDGAIDLILVAGWYCAISFVARSLRLPMEPATPQLPHPSDRNRATVTEPVTGRP